MNFKHCRSQEQRFQLEDLRRGKHRWLCTRCDQAFVWAEGAMWNGAILCEDDGHCHAMLCPTCAKGMPIREERFVRLPRAETPR